MYKKAKKGDVFTLETKCGYAYLQCVRDKKDGKQYDMWEIVRILPGTHREKSLKIAENLVKCKEVFFLEFMLGYALKDRIVEYIGSFDVPEESNAPRYYRSELRWPNGEIHKHIIDSYNKKTIGTWTEEQLDLSPWGMWSVDELIESIEDGWTLDQWR